LAKVTSFIGRGKKEEKGPLGGKGKKKTGQWKNINGTF